MCVSLITSIMTTLRVIDHQHHAVWKHALKGLTVYTLCCFVVAIVTHWDGHTYKCSTVLVCTYVNKLGMYGFQQSFIFQYVHMIWYIYSYLCKTHKRIICSYVHGCNCIHFMLLGMLTTINVIEQTSTHMDTSMVSMTM